MKRLLIIALGILVLAGCSNASAEEKTKNEAPVVEKKAVEVVSVEDRQMIGRLVMPGQVEADKVQSVSSLVSGQIEALYAEVGDYVEEGTLLVEIDDEFTKLQKNQADIGSSLSSLSLESAKRSYERTKALYESGSVTQAQYDGASDMLAKAKLDYSMGSNSVSQMRYQLKHMDIKAPISGVISMKMQNVGLAVNPGSPIYEIVDINDVIVEAGVTEGDINRLAKEQVVSVDLPAANLIVDGTVEGVGPVQQQGGTYPVRVRIANEEGLIKPGMYAELSIETEKPKNVLAVPKIAVLHENGRDYVFVAEGEKAVKKEIQKGLAFETYFEVLSGLEDGEKIVVSGQAYLDDGDVLEIIE
ncbi:efflux RND transporter periplasmic adaptor subunit [Fusibacter sp. JL216-2]|uniref:efflux RND transporter periplasmic adaptor subunit n=1 Tax=Fusibacter sp. JL216-2 TaxID=3071453 RepID=UPI003D34821F